MEDSISLFSQLFANKSNGKKRKRAAVVAAASLLDSQAQACQFMACMEEIRHGQLLRKQKKRTRQPQERLVNYKLDSLWGKMLWGQDGSFNPKLLQPDSRAAKLFRNRFRLPFSSFQQLCQLSSVLSCCQYSQADVTGRQSIPYELKLLGVLRILGRGWYFGKPVLLSAVLINVS